ncbi:MAG: HNH endonuclease [Solirubrobacteraceae bacterium]
MLALGLLAAVALSGPVAHTSAVCADFSNQAAAQRSHDTRDGDGDGILCESLPCPCLGPGTAPAAPSSPVRAGRSVRLGPITQREGCRVHGRLPDRGCTPGARFRGATREKICRPGYSAAVRDVSDAKKDAVYAAYGMTAHFDGRDGEVDHLVALELGGSNARANLFPEAAPGSAQKDRLENALHAEVCDGSLSLRRAQHLIARNWVRAYRARFA